MADRLSGKAAYWTWGGTTIPITKITPKVTRKLGDTTDSGDYDATGDMLPTTQIPVGYTVEATIEGRFRYSTTPSVLLQFLFQSATQITCVFGLDINNSTIWGSGLFDVSDFQTDIPVDDIVTYTATIRSYGVFTPNS